MHKGRAQEYVGRKELPKGGVFGKSEISCHFPSSKNGLHAHESDKCQAAGFTPSDVRNVKRIKSYL